MGAEEVWRGVFETVQMHRLRAPIARSSELPGRSFSMVSIFKGLLGGADSGAVTGVQAAHQSRLLTVSTLSATQRGALTADESALPARSSNVQRGKRLVDVARPITPENEGSSAAAPADPRQRHSIS